VHRGQPHQPHQSQQCQVQHHRRAASYYPIGPRATTHGGCEPQLPHPGSHRNPLSACRPCVSRITLKTLNGPDSEVGGE
jgi:hypothetical protein